MGLFDRFKKRVNEVAEQTDADALSAEANSDEAQAAIAAADRHASSVQTPAPSPPAPVEVEEPPTDEWEDLDALDPVEPVQTGEWDDLGDEDDIELPRELSRRERKLIEKVKKAEGKRERQQKKEMKKRGAVEVARPKGSKVDLSMMRTTTGRQLVSVADAP